MLYTISKKPPPRPRGGKGEGNEKENACRLCAGGSAEPCASGGVRHGTNNLSGQETESAVTELSALEGYTVTGVDSLGIVSANRTDTAETEYVLYSAGRSAVIATASSAFTRGLGGAVCDFRNTDGRQYGVYRVRQERAGHFADDRVGRIVARIFGGRRHGRVPERGSPVRRHRRRGAYGLRFVAHAVRAVRAGGAAQRRLLCGFRRGRAQRL